MERDARSRTNSTSSLRSPVQPATPSHTPNPAGGGGRQHQNLSPDQLAAGISRVRAERGYGAGGSRSSSIPATPAPTPNPLLQVQVMYPEQLAAGISNLKADEGYVDSTSFPATPAPSPFSPSPAQSACFTPDQVAEGIQRLRREEETGEMAMTSGASTGQPPTPSTTPGVSGGVLAGGAQHQQLGVIPEHLAAGISHLRGGDEGMESASNPSTLLATPISPSPATNQVLPEQLVAGIHRLKVEEGMSSGGSSGFPSTPAPTPFIHHPGGVRPEDLAAGISRLSVIEEGVVNTKEDSNASTSSQPDLSQYFGGGGSNASDLNDSVAESKSFFDQLEEESHDAMLHSCRESRVDLTKLEATGSGDAAAAAFMEPSRSEARIEIAEQKYDDARSLQHRRSSESGGCGGEKSHHHSSSNSCELEHNPPAVCTIFGAVTVDEADDPFDTIGIQTVTTGDEGEKQQVPTSLPLPSVEVVTPTASTAPSSQYSTPVAPTPSLEQVSLSQQSPLGYSTYVTSTPVHQVTMPQPITSPLPNSAPFPAPVTPQQQLLFNTSSSIDESLILPDEIVPEAETLQDAESIRRYHAWIPNAATGQILQGLASATPGGAAFYPDRSCLTMPGVVVREELVDPIKNLVAHYRGESEAAKRQVLTADSVTQDQRGLRQLVRAGCFRAAINLTARLLQMYNQGPGQGGNLSKHTPSSLQIWFSRIALLVKLRQFSVAEMEAEPFGDLDRPDLYFQFYPEMYPKRFGSMVPFGFRVLIAELPQFLGKPHETLDQLYALLEKVDKILQNLTSGRTENGSATTPMNEQDRDESLALWIAREIRIIYSLANCAIMQKDFDLAVTILSILLEKETSERKPKVMSALGRIYLQLGDIESAQSCFSQARQLRTATDTDSTSCDHLLDASMLSIANNDYESALGSLREAHGVAPGNASVINNMAVCFLYLGRLKEGLSFLESNITANPHLLLQETPILNLCTLYELESSYAGQKKRALLDLVSQFRGDGINSSCLKLQM